MSDAEQAPITGSSTLDTPSEREIVTERVFEATRERVWAAFTEPALIERWWGRFSTTTVVEEQQLEPGGTWRFVEQNGDGSKTAFRGVYREVLAPERLVYTFEWEGMPGHVLVDFADFEDLGERTRIRIRSLFHERSERDGMIEGGMEVGLNEGYRELDALLAELASS